MKTIALFIFSIGLYAFSCDNQTPISTIDSEGQSEVSGIVVYAGDPAVDGCGWLVQHQENVYSPINLDPSFNIDSLKVILSFKVLDSTWKCGWREPGYKRIEILNIKKQ